MPLSQGDGIQVEQMSQNDDISNFLSRSARPCCCSLISVSSSLPLGTRSTHTEAPLGTFQWMHGVRKPDASTMIRPTDSFVKKRPRFRRWRVYASLVFIGEQWDIAAMGLLSEICQTYKYNLPSLYKYQVCKNIIYQERLYKCILPNCFQIQYQVSVRDV